MRRVICASGPAFSTRHSGFLISPDPATAIIEELSENPRAMAALTTHGRTAWREALLGSVALKVTRGGKTSRAPLSAAVLQFNHPSEDHHPSGNARRQPFSEKILPSTIEMAKLINSRIMLVQALPTENAAAPRAALPSGDVLESSYLQAKAAESRKSIKSSRAGTCSTAKPAMRYADT